jgi:hypothetical protein
MPQSALRSPLNDPDLHNELRLHPLRLAHLFRRDATAPAIRLRVRQVHEGASVNAQRCQLPYDRPQYKVVGGKVYETDAYGNVRQQKFQIKSQQKK